MNKILVLDLEGVLINSVRDPKLHPEARQVLELARRDFQETYLWTLSRLKGAKKILGDYGLLRYFDRLIGIYEDNDELRHTMIYLKDGVWNKKHMFLPDTIPPKDLSLLASPDRIVLIDDVLVPTGEDLAVYARVNRISLDDIPDNIRTIRLGKPADRVVHIESYRGQEGHSLIHPYNLAVNKFDAA